MSLQGKGKFTVAKRQRFCLYYDHQNTQTRNVKHNINTKILH